MVVHGTASPALLPARFGKFVFAVLGLTKYPVQASNAVHTPLARPAGRPHAVQLGNRTPGNFASQYGLNALYKKGARGQGETIGIITFANFRPSDATHFWANDAQDQDQGQAHHAGQHRWWLRQGQS